VWGTGTGAETPAEQRSAPCVAMTITTTQLARTIERARHARWTLGADELDTVIDAVRHDHQPVFTGLVTCARQGDTTAGEVLVWSVLPDLRRLNDRRWGDYTTIDDLIGLAWLTIVDIDLDAVPSRRTLVNRIKRRVERAGLDGRWIEQEHLRAHRRVERTSGPVTWLDPDLFPRLFDPADVTVSQLTGDAAAWGGGGGRTAPCWQDTTSRQALDRAALRDLANVVQTSIDNGRFTAETWQTMIDWRIHEITSPATDARKISASTSRVARATRVLREQLRDRAA